jgi:hypothetical protein
MRINLGDASLVDDVVAHVRGLPGWLAFRVDSATVEVIALDARSRAAEERLVRTELHAVLASRGVEVGRRKRLGQW